MSEFAGFYHNTTTQRPNKTRTPSAHMNESTDSQIRPKKLSPAKDPSVATRLDSKRLTRQRPPTSTSSQSTNSTSAKADSQTLEDFAFDSMLSTPLPDYKHSANQTNKARAAAQTNRKSSSTSSGNSADRKHALQIAAAERAAATRLEAGRSSSLSSTTGSSGLTTVTSSEPSTEDFLARPFSLRNGRRVLRDATLPYPLPCDLAELHRQILRTMLLCQVFNGPVCSPAFSTKAPKRVLEVGCGTGFWSSMCHRHFSQRGFSSISFTGVDIAPLAAGMESDDDMNWRFVQHDIRRVPYPFRDDEFSLIMIKDMSMTIPTADMQQAYIDEYIRILKPGGTLEIWDGDHSLRMLLPHAPPATKVDDEGSEDEGQVYTNAMGTYTLTTQTPFAAPQCSFLNDYNTWISKALEARKLNPMPCTTYRPILLQEPDLTEMDSRRLAIPLGEVRWEREGVGGAVTQGTNGHVVSSKDKAREVDRKILTPRQAALRRTALMTVVQMIESLEPLLREASGKGQDEWDRWQGNMMNDLLKQNGTSWGECLEVGAWWAKKKEPQI